MGYRSYRRPADPIPRVTDPAAGDLLSSEEVQRRILQVLTVAARKKWQIRDALTINEKRLTRELQALKIQKRVYLRGNGSSTWTWVAGQPPQLTLKRRRQEPRRKPGQLPRPLRERYADLFE